jgi:hypothetical protein
MMEPNLLVMVVMLLPVVVVVQQFDRGIPLNYLCLNQQPKADFAKTDFEDRNYSENEPIKASWDRWNRQRKPSSIAAGNSAHSIKQLRSLFLRRKSRLESVLERRRKRAKFAASHSKSGPLSPTSPERPTVVGMRSLPVHREGDGGTALFLVVLP